LFAGILWISLGTACSSPAQPAGTDGSLRVACEWPRSTGLQAVAVVPVLVIREGQIVARSILVRDNPAVTLSGMTAGPVTVLAAALSGDATPVMADEVGTLIKAKDTARVVLDLQPQNATPERLTIFGPLMGELRRIAADIAARDAAFFSGQTGNASNVAATPSLLPPAPPGPPVAGSPEPQRALINGLPGGGDPNVAPVTSKVTAATGGGGGGGGGGTASTPQPSPTPTPTSKPSASATVPWGSIPGVPSGTASASASPSTSPWGVPDVPPVPGASVPPIPL
jgi:hypothetical protein